MTDPNQKQNDDSADQTSQTDTTGGRGQGTGDSANTGTENAGIDTGTEPENEQ